MTHPYAKVQPQAIPLEQAVLGALMLDREAVLQVVDLLPGFSPTDLQINPFAFQQVGAGGLVDRHGRVKEVRRS